MDLEWYSDSAACASRQGSQKTDQTCSLVHPTTNMQHKLHWMTFPFKMSLSTQSSRYYMTCIAQCLDVITTISKLTFKITLTISQMLGPLLQMVVQINYQKVVQFTRSKKSFHSKSQSNVLITDKTHLISSNAHCATEF